MPRFFIPQVLDHETLIALPEKTCRHIKVLRLKQGDHIILFNGDGFSYTAHLEFIDKKHTVAHIIEREDKETESDLHLTLIQSISTAERMDYSIQKSVELGVTDIYPVISEYGTVRLSDERAEKRWKRWQDIVIAACEQCGRDTIPTVHPIQKFAQILRSLPDAEAYFLLSIRGKQHLRQIDIEPKSICLLIGPEGGLSPSEENAAMDTGFRPLLLGPRILRTETAGLATLSAIQTRWGDF